MWFRKSRTQPAPVLRSFAFVLPGNTEVTISAYTASEALQKVRAEYGCKAYREAWLVDNDRLVGAHA